MMNVLSVLQVHFGLLVYVMVLLLCNGDFFKCELLLFTYL